MNRSILTRTNKNKNFSRILIQKFIIAFKMGAFWANLSMLLYNPMFLYKYQLGGRKKPPGSKSGKHSDCAMTLVSYWTKKSVTIVLEYDVTVSCRKIQNFSVHIYDRLLTLLNEFRVNHNTVSKNKKKKNYEHQLNF